MDFADILLVFHIIGVAVWLGANAVQAFAGPRVPSAAKEARIWWAATQGAMSRVLYSVAGVLVLVTGILLVLQDRGEFSSAFVSIGFLAVAIGIALGIAVFGPGCRTLVSAIEEGDGAAEKAIVNKLTMFGIIDTLVVVFTIFAMVGGWGR